MAHIMFVRALTVLLFLTTAANAGSVKELALIALLGGGDLTCGDAYLSKGQFDFIDRSCQMTTEKYGICELLVDDASPFIAKIEFAESDGKLTISVNGRPVGTCD